MRKEIIWKYVSLHLDVKITSETMYDLRIHQVNVYPRVGTVMNNLLNYTTSECLTFNANCPRWGRDTDTSKKCCLVYRLPMYSMPPRRVANSGLYAFSMLLAWPSFDLITDCWWNETKNSCDVILVHYMRISKTWQQTTIPINSWRIILWIVHSLQFWLHVFFKWQLKLPDKIVK